MNKSIKKKIWLYLKNLFKARFDYITQSKSHIHTHISMFVNLKFEKLTVDGQQH